MRNGREETIGMLKTGSSSIIGNIKENFKNNKMG